VAADYSYTINPDTRFQSVFEAKIRDGVLEDVGPIPLLKTHDSLQVDVDDPTMELHKARVRLRMTDDGGLEGLIGGYRDWYDYFRIPVGSSGHGWENGRGPTQGAVTEKYGHFNLVGFYYSLRRNADGIPNADGQNTAISVAYRYYLKPAFVVTPDAKQIVEVARIIGK